MPKETVTFPIIQYNRINMIFFLAFDQLQFSKKLNRGDVNDPSIKNY